MKEIKEIQGLILLEDLDNSFLVELRYATENNFTGQVIYPVSVCALRRETAEKLIKAHEIVKKDGYRIKIWDAYRPLHVQKHLYDIFPDNNFVAKPPEVPITSGFRRRHNNGMAVDITLVDENGVELEMPSEFDDFSEKASPTNPNMSEAAKKNINYMVNVMRSVGFEVHDDEWWHFVDAIEEPNPYLDIPLESFLKMMEE